MDQQLQAQAALPPLQVLFNAMAAGRGEADNTIRDMLYTWLGNRRLLSSIVGLGGLGYFVVANRLFGGRQHFSSNVMYMPCDTVLFGNIATAAAARSS